ncbi:hypothetical protein [Streptomyces sp. NPDC047079]|uniref:hypothetical protein n=1 Tax=Streptomyces sp. NPDC047079 TaxID=3154607 RepID=UPI003401492F
MPTRSQVLRLLADGLDYEEAGRRLGVPAGQAFLIATGLPADGGDALTAQEQHRPGMTRKSTQHLSHPQASNPAAKEAVHQWLEDAEEFDDLADELVGQLRRHVAFEDAVFARLRENLPQDERERLGSEVVRAWQAAPTRPHPHAPQRPPPAVATAGKAAALVDRLRDAVGARPAERGGTG